MYKINFYTVSPGSEKTEFIQDLFKPEKHINFGGNFHNFSDTTKFAKHDTSQKPSLILINDYSFNKNDVLNLVNENGLLEEYKKILYTASTDRNYINRLCNSKINGILHKQDTHLFGKYNRTLPAVKQGKEKLIQIINLVNDGCTFYDSKITSLLPKRYAWARNDANDKLIPQITEETLSWQLKETSEKILQEWILLMRWLSTREKEILLLIARGRQNKEMAIELNISVGTVEQHKNHIIQKLRLKSTIELIIFSVRMETIIKKLVN